MTIQEMYTAYWSEEVLEYHLMGMEQGAGQFPGPGWYSCRVDYVHDNGNVEISFADPGIRHLGATVLKRNIPIAFRRKAMASADNIIL